MAADSKSGGRGKTIMIIVLVVIAVFVLRVNKGDPERTSEKTQRTAADRRIAFHCLSAWDGARGRLQNRASRAALKSRTARRNGSGPFAPELAVSPILGCQ